MRAGTRQAKPWSDDIGGPKFTQFHGDRAGGRPCQDDLDKQPRDRSAKTSQCPDVARTSASSVQVGRSTITGLGRAGSTRSKRWRSRLEHRSTTAARADLSPAVFRSGLGEDPNDRLGLLGRASPTPAPVDCGCHPWVSTRSRELSSPPRRPIASSRRHSTLVWTISYRGI